jgi:hypothetical protein
MGLWILELCRLCFIRFNYIRNEEKDAILPTNLLYLYYILRKRKSK